jgi:hypothetical protein
MQDAQDISWLFFSYISMCRMHRTFLGFSFHTSAYAGCTGHFLAFLFIHQHVQDALHQWTNGDWAQGNGMIASDIPHHCEV